MTIVRTSCFPRAAFLLPAVALLLATPAVTAAETTPDALHQALETKQRIEQRVASQLSRDSSAQHARPAAAAHGAHGTAAAPAHAAPTTALAHGEPAAGAHAAETDVWSRLLAGNRRFASGRTRVRAVMAQRAALVAGQHPEAVVLACADSRVSPELLFDQSLGDLFVVRAAGNVEDPIILGSMEYAVEHLHAKLIVVLGHGSCGAVKAALSGDEMPSPNLVALVDKIRPTVQRLNACFEGAELVERGAKANARHTAIEVMTNSKILREAVEKGHLKIVSGFYDLTTGMVTPLE